MVRLKVPPVRIVVFFLFVVVATFALTQAHLTQAEPAHSDSTLKTITHIVVHAPHNSSPLLSKGL